MNDETQQRVLTALAVGITFALSRLVTQRFIRVPERRGIKDDVLEAVLKGGTTAFSTVLASVIVRRLLRGAGRLSRAPVAEKGSRGCGRDPVDMEARPCGRGVSREP